MTKRTNKPKATPTVSQNATEQPVEAIKQESNTKVATKGKTSTNASQKATAKPRGRPEKTKVEVGVLTDHIIGYDPNWHKNPATNTTSHSGNLGKIVSEPKTSLYDRFVGWLFRITYNFRGY